MVSRISPMNWGMQAYYDVLLRNGTILDVLPEIALLLTFAIVMFLVTLLIVKNRQKI